MSQPFTFPPPPPPPPKLSQNQNAFQQSNSKGAHRGRGSYQSSLQNGRGRGQHPPSGGQRGGYGTRVNGMIHSRGGNTSYSQNFASPYPSFQSRHLHSSPSVNQAQKRNHATAFSNASDHATRNSRPTAPPAVPSFGIDLDSLLSKKPEAQKPLAKGPVSKPNLLGLTPHTRDSDSEEDDEGEETKLASTGTSNNLLRFEYEGQTSTLQTPEEIAAWIAERRKRWPTEAKRESARKEAEERKQKWEAEKAARQEASVAAAKARHEERLRQKIEREKIQIRQRLLKEHILKSKSTTAANIPQSAAQRKAEKLRRKAEKIAQQLKVAEAALGNHDGAPHRTSATDADLDTLLAQVDTIASAKEAQAHGFDLSDDASDASDASSARLDTNGNDDTSTSGSSSDSESGSDSAPEESSSKRIAPDRVLPPPRKAPPGAATMSSIDSRPLCKNFAQTGRCKYGRRCHFKHEKPPKKDESVTGNRRKGLYQVLVEKEQEAEKKRALRVIIALGDAGVLDDPPLNTEPTKNSSVEEADSVVHH